MELSHRMQPDNPCPLLMPIATRLRSLLPADLYIAAWIDLSSEVAMQVFEHLRSLHWILHDYVPRQVAQSPPQPGQLHWNWQEGTLLFTDLAGFTPLMEANARCGQVGIEMMLAQLNAYFTTMIEILSKSGGICWNLPAMRCWPSFPPIPNTGMSNGRFGRAYGCNGQWRNLRTY